MRRSVTRSPFINRSIAAISFADDLARVQLMGGGAVKTVTFEGPGAIDRALERLPARLRSRYSGGQACGRRHHPRSQVDLAMMPDPDPDIDPDDPDPPGPAPEPEPDPSPYLPEDDEDGPEPPHTPDGPPPDPVEGSGPDPNYCRPIN